MDFKTVAIGGLVLFAGNYLYKLYKLDQGLEYKPFKVKFDKTTKTIDVVFEFSNTTKSSLKVNYVSGEIIYNNEVISEYKSNSFTIEPLQNLLVTFKFNINAKPIAKNLFNIFASNLGLSSVKPITIKYKINNGLFNIPQKFEVNPKDML